NELIGDSLEGRHDLRQNQTDTGQDDKDPRREGDRLYDGKDDEMGSVAEIFFDVVRSRDDGDDNIEDRHGQCDADRAVAQKSQPFRKVDFFGGRGILADNTSNRPRQNIAQGAEMTETNLVVAGDFSHVRLGQCGKDAHDQSQSQRTDQYQLES